MLVKILNKFYRFTCTRMCTFIRVNIYIYGLLYCVYIFLLYNNEFFYRYRIIKFLKLKFYIQYNNSIYRSKNVYVKMLSNMCFCLMISFLIKINLL